MGLLGGKAIIIAAALLLLIGWGIGNGYVRFETDNYKCFGNSGFYAAVPKQRLMTLGRIHVYYQPLSWGCDTDHRYDPKVYRTQDGQIVPIQPQGL